MSTKMIITDAEILERLKKGDKKALTILYDSYWKPLFSSSYLLLKDRELCEEIIQDIFIEIWNRRSDLQIKVSFKSYLYASVRYKVFAEFRKNKPERVELYDDINARFQYATPETRMIHEELEQHVRLVVENLPEKCQLVFKLSRNEQLSHKQIAEQLGISTKTVENHITNALKILRDSLGNALAIEIILHFLR
ncbi:RNA polymerase sigma-70 factor [Flavobacterium chungangense]|uniref:RNA polymerase sigma-70 factor n=2 Tax=Flavobacterium chungangense TaxID=554283 RepID=A0A6V6YYZ8_9FLAO|nr:RNA polymerase sigma-70 factor [Flavobacterium chungangense]